MVQKRMTQTQALTIGKMKITKGYTDDGIRIYQWDVGVPCRHETCPAVSQCDYEANIEGGADCQVLRKYMIAASLVLYDDQKDLSSAQRFQIGMHVMPLYRVLCRMKIEEIGVASISYLDDKGMRRIDPLYKEIRETIKAIDQVWKSIGSYAAKPKDIPVPTFGETNYYDAMEKAALKENNPKVSQMRRKK